GRDARPGGALGGGRGRRRRAPRARGRRRDGPRPRAPLGARQLPLPDRLGPRLPLRDGEPRRGGARGAGGQPTGPPAARPPRRPPAGAGGASTRVGETGARLAKRGGPLLGAPSYRPFSRVATLKRPSATPVS